MTTPVDRNRLADTHSPYLRQHADNPVHWQPWDEFALEAATTRDIPIFLSIGYAACHWCHVMEKESFQNDSIAERMNQQFVPIKVDREERPDIDRIYQTVCQLVTGSGGWPLSAWLTPDGRPFYIGTYFPPTPARGRPGFAELLDRIAQTWRNDRDALEDRADQWHTAARKELEVTGSSSPKQSEDRSVLIDAAEAAVRSADRSHGGFGEHGPKFPQPQRIDLLLQAAARTDEESSREIAGEALQVMADRGLYDHVGGGFHRYATDREWRIPHFEKMLYDNAELPRVYLAAFQQTGANRFADVVQETIGFLDRELTHPEGGIYSTLDAQSDGSEGTYYVWTPAGVHDAIDDAERASLFCERYGVTEEGNFEGGTSVLAIHRDVEALAEQFDKSVSTIESELERAKGEIFRAREHRERPRRDEKILASWNGLAISMLAEAGLILGQGYEERARSALSFVRANHWDDRDQRLSRRYMEGAVGVDGYLDDYAYLARGAFDLYQATGELDALEYSMTLASEMISDFWDESDETLYYTPEGGESLVTRPQDLPDQSLPSSTGVALDVLLSLDPFRPGDRFESIAGKVLETHRSRITGAPLQHPSLVLADERYRSGSLELTIVADSLRDPWRDFVAETYLPNRLLARRPPDDQRMDEWLDRLGLDSTPPIWRGRTQKSGQTTVYVCRDFTCSPPIDEVSDATAWIEELGPAV